MTETKEPLLEISDLSMAFDGRRVLNGLHLKVFEKEIVGLIGESGAGKTMTALSVLGLLPRRATVDSGRILYRGANLLELTSRELRQIRGCEIGMVFQDPRSALNPVMRIDRQLSEGMRCRLGYSKNEARQESERLLLAVGIQDPVRCLAAYPHQLSGGMRQRVLIASALSCKPDFLICDEITSSVDSIVQSQLLTLLGTVRNDFKTSILLITHDLRAIMRVTDRIVVLLEGRVVEEGSTRQVFGRPAHDFTRSLIASLPTLEP